MTCILTVDDLERMKCQGLQLKLILTNIWLWAIKFILSQNFCA